MLAAAEGERCAGETERHGGGYEGPGESPVGGDEASDDGTQCGRTDPEQPRDGHEAPQQVVRCQDLARRAPTTLTVVDAAPMSVRQATATGTLSVSPVSSQARA